MRLKLPLPVLAVLVVTGCQAIWGDYRVDDSALRPPEPEEPCEQMGYRCDGATLELCFMPPSNWIQIPCEAGLVCDAVKGSCRAPDSATSGGAGGTTVSSGGAVAGNTGGRVAGSGGATSSGGSSSSSGGVAGSVSSGGSASGGVPPASTGGAGEAAGAGGDCSADTAGCGPKTPEDACPNDPLKTQPGACGCGVVDALECAVLRASLAQRFSFDGTGATAQNSVGAGQGVIQNALLTGSGALELAGTTTDQYVDLPNGMVSTLVNATFEAWLTWRGGAAWQRVFDFGSNQNAEGAQGTGATYLFLTPMATNTTGFARVAFTTSGNAGETKLDAKRALTVGAVSHVAVVVDDDNNLIWLYLDGQSQGSVAFTGQLAQLSDVNNWLGRSQFSTDPELNASLDEFRIYRTALGANELAASFAAGPNPAFFAR